MAAKVTKIPRAYESCKAPIGAWETNIRSDGNFCVFLQPKLRLN